MLRACGQKRAARRSTRASDRAHKGRAEHEAACRDRCQGTAPEVLYDGGPSQRLHRRRRPAGQPGRCRMADCRPGLRCRLVQGSVERQGDKALHPRPEVSRQGRPLRQTPLQTPQPDRDYVRQAEGLAAHCHPLRQVRGSLPLGHPSRRKARRSGLRAASTTRR